MTIRDVAALYVDKDGHYPNLVVDWYDEERDARTYAGSGAIVAHPPCGPWSRLRNWCRHQDAGAGIHAVEVVRRLGGVLEHPAESLLWEACSLPRPHENPDAWGGFTFAIEQWRWGYGCVKPTWLYCVGLDADVVAEALEATVEAGLNRPSADAFWSLGPHARRVTPLPLARALVRLAARARVPSASPIAADTGQPATLAWGRLVKALRAGAGQRRMARLLGVTQTRVTRLERGRGGGMTADELVQLARVIGAPLDALAAAAGAESHAHHGRGVSASADGDT